MARATGDTPALRKRSDTERVFRFFFFFGTLPSSVARALAAGGASFAASASTLSPGLKSTRSTTASPAGTPPWPAAAAAAPCPSSSAATSRCPSAYTGPPSIPFSVMTRSPALDSAPKRSRTSLHQAPAKRSRNTSPQPSAPASPTALNPTLAGRSALQSSSGRPASASWCVHAPSEPRPGQDAPPSASTSASHSQASPSSAAPSSSTRAASEPSRSKRRPMLPCTPSSEHVDTPARRLR
mmetsp:Transcript_13752/g.57477  ORF Transcript_13752/g.57477 Transcript_13752/m.57477 type:complete len:240 (+) Transcript_13752:460-1179(+)